jgi:hypothetical protein
MLGWELEADVMGSRRKFEEGLVIILLHDSFQGPISSSMLSL